MNPGLFWTVRLVCQELLLWLQKFLISAVFLVVGFSWIQLDEWLLITSILEGLWFTNKQHAICFFFKGYINDLLSMRVWVPMSRLTFGAYLLHPLVIMFFFNAQGNAYHYAENLVVRLVYMSVYGKQRCNVLSNSIHHSNEELNTKSELLCNLLFIG